MVGTLRCWGRTGALAAILASTSTATADHLAVSSSQGGFQPSQPLPVEMSLPLTEDVSLFASRGLAWQADGWPSLEVGEAPVGSLASRFRLAPNLEISQPPQTDRHPLMSGPDVSLSF